MNNSYNGMNNNYFNNNLVSGYQNFQKNNIPFQNNPLLNNNPQFMNMANNRQMQMDIYNNMMRYKKAQEMKKMHRSNEIDNVFDKALIHESVIRPIKIIKEDSNDVINKFKKLDSNWESERQKGWSQRTNQPYKNIIKSDNRFLGRAKIEKEELIVHRVTDADKIGLLEEFTDLVNILEKHNNELKIVYSTSKEMEHKKKFEYVHRDKYRIKYDPKDYGEMKKDQLDYYKKEQQKLEKDKKNVIDIIESLMNKGILKEEDIKFIEEEEKQIDNEDTFSNLEKQLKNELGDDYSKLEKEAIKLLEKEKNQEVKSKVSSTAKSKVIIKSRPKEKKEDTETIHNKLSSNIDDLKTKYQSRQKK